VPTTDPATERYTAAAAPDALRRVQSFLNTRGLGSHPDLLDRPATANPWLASHDWPTPPPRLRTADLPPLRQLRATLQDALGDGGADLAPLLAPLRWRMAPDAGGALALIPDGRGWHAVAGALLSDILLAQHHDLWPRLKPCRNPVCAVVFYDNSKNRSRVWHDTATCGNVTNLRNARQRARISTLR
jgi:hypothetical protein